MNKRITIISKYSFDQMHVRGYEKVFFELGKRFYQEGYIVEWYSRYGLKDINVKGISFKQINIFSFIRNFFTRPGIIFSDTSLSSILFGIPFLDDNFNLFVPDNISTVSFFSHRSIKKEFQRIKNFLIFKFFNFKIFTFSNKLHSYLSSLNSAVIKLETVRESVPQDKIEKNKYQLISFGPGENHINYEHQLEAVKILKTQFPDTRLLIVGAFQEQSYLNKLKNMVNSYSLDHNVTFLQNTGEENKFILAGRSIAVLNTSFELNWIFDHLKCISLGTPFVSYRTIGEEKFFTHRKTGFFTYHDTPIALAQAVSKLFSDEKSYLALTESCKDSVSSYNWDNFFEDLKANLDLESNRLHSIKNMNLHEGFYSLI